MGWAKDQPNVTKCNPEPPCLDKETKKLQRKWAGSMALIVL